MPKYVVSRAFVTSVEVEAANKEEAIAIGKHQRQEHVWQTCVAVLAGTEATCDEPYHMDDPRSHG